MNCPKTYGNLYDSLFKLSVKIIAPCHINILFNPTSQRSSEYLRNVEHQITTNLLLLT